MIPTESTPWLRIDGLTKRFSTYTALSGVSLTVNAGDIAALLGPSGCGKTTLLRCIAGLETPDQGSIEIARKPVFDRETGRNAGPEQRGVGFVFQDYALWPHMTVEANVAYGLRIQHVPRSEIRERVHAILDVVGLKHLGSRYPHELSGGQQQRVALARSVVTEPQVLLLDEPLSNLDSKLREEMRRHLRGLVKQIGVTAVFVTHDHSEAFALADVVHVMNEGALLESGSPEDVYRYPSAGFTAGFIGQGTRLRGVSSSRSGDVGSEVLLENGVALHSANVAAIEGECGILVRPEEVTIAVGEQVSGPRATIADHVFLGREYEYVIDWGGTSLRAISPIGPLEVGTSVTLKIGNFHVYVH